MKNLLLYFFISIYFCGYSQSDYLAYHSKINQAEMYFLDNKIDSCFIKYNEVFNTFDKCLPNDAYIAGQIAVHHKKYDYAYDYFKEGFEWGLNTKIFEREEFFKDFKKDSNYTKLLNDYVGIRKLYESKIDTVYRNQIIKFRKKDLQLNKTHNLFNRIFFDKATSRKLSNASKGILDEMKKVINQKGLPSIDKIGVHDCDIFSNSTQLAGIGNTLLISTLYVHHEKAFDDNENILKNMLLNGDISSYYYACIKDITFRWHYFNKSKKERKKIKQIDYFYHVRWLSSEDIENINEEEKKTINIRRLEIGLMPLEYEIKKKKLIINPDYPIHFNYWTL